MNAQLEGPFGAGAARAGGALLQLEGVGKAFGAVRAVDGVTLSAERQEVLGLIGPNGAGKTTVVNLISAYFSPSEGRITFAGASVDGLRPHQLAARGIARTYQNLRLFDESTVLDNVLIGRHLAFGKQPRRSVLWPGAQRRERAAAAALIERLGLGDLAGERVSELSYGVRRRVEIARALAIEPSLLLLDEPTAGMTRTESDEIGRLVGELRDDGMTVLLVDHNVRLVSEVCDRVAVLDWGRLVTIDAPDAVWSDERVRDAYLGTRQGGS
ncbi:ABC transporter ATP-binding protein [Desertimonas flava]|uniref:ABC transporter ATP-binding protein n=1 Tax=Desertimonas flava TaxID=2064846 RepID=UPI00196967A6|nr:ABC transporter ATP-binding protein [Desertimonas flava]